LNAGHLTRRPLRGRNRFGWMRLVGMHDPTPQPEAMA
jgi:hypothetical protein